MAKAIYGSVGNDPRTLAELVRDLAPRARL